MTGTRGAISELRACAWLLGKGYQVFRNVSPVGAIDIVAIKDNEILLLDAKTIALVPNGKRTLTPEEILVRAIRVHENGECRIDLRPLPPRKSAEEIAALRAGKTVEQLNRIKNNYLSQTKRY